MPDGFDDLGYFYVRFFLMSLGFLAISVEECILFAALLHVVLVPADYNGYGYLSSWLYPTGFDVSAIIEEECILMAARLHVVVEFIALVSSLRGSADCTAYGDLFLACVVGIVLDWPRFFSRYAVDLDFSLWGCTPACRLGWPVSLAAVPLPPFGDFGFLVLVFVGSQFVAAPRRSPPSSPASV